MSDAAKSVKRGLDWLFAQQGADGGWHSKTYGQLKDGASVTALALYAAPSEPPSEIAAGLKRGFDFLETGLKKRGTIASPDGSLDFPTYASALWLSAVNRWLLQKNYRPVVKYLLGAQIGEARGFDNNSPSYGGWDFLGPGDARGITTGTNISVTRYVLKALNSQLGRYQFGGLVKDLADAITASITGPGKAYVLRCQQADGGFAFTPEPASLNNKAAYSDAELTKPRSYGSATCDGVLALLACGLKPEDEPVAKAIAWLAKRPGLEVVPGFEGLPAEDGWDRGLRFYYYAALSDVLRYFPLSERTARQEALVKHVVSLQKDDGSWANESDRMRENDPLIATALAIVALSGMVSLSSQ